MQKPLLSYITAVYNKADVLEETLACLRAQEGLSEHEVEFIFVDDYSCDNSVALLQQKAAQDPRVTLITNSTNRGPAIRFNEAAKAAKGDYLLALDADDILPPNAAQFLLDIARKKGADAVFGKSKRSLECVPIPSDALILTPSDPLAFAAKKKIVRMGFLAKRELWLKSGGADERIFIQDQSLPLHLCKHANTIAFVEDFIYFLRPADVTNLSANVMQQHHDRFFALEAFLHDDTLSPDARKAVIKQIASTIWKARRDNGKPLPQFSKAHWIYLQNKLTGRAPSPEELSATARMMHALPNIKRPIKNHPKG